MYTETAEAACECTESDLADIKLTRKSISTIPTIQQVAVFQAVLDDVRASSANLATTLNAEFLKTSPSEDQAGKRFFQCWLDIILLYPNVAVLKMYIESNFRTYPDLAPVFYQNIQIIAESFVRCDMRLFCRPPSTHTHTCMS